jgi:hypothetical protein
MGNSTRSRRSRPKGAPPTLGTETSKYQEEKKSTETLQVVASERGPAISAPVLVWKTQAHRKQSLL